MANKYEGLPKKIFGPTCPQHRAQRVREFLTHNNVPFRQRATKVTLLKHLVVQQNGLTPNEEHAISLWFLGFEDRSVVKYRQVPKTTLVHRSIQKGSAYSTTKSLQAKQSLPAECSVCMESLLGEQFPQKRLAASCAHKPTICLRCLAQSLQHQIKEKPWDHVACPECPERLSFEVVKKFATKASFERYDKKSVLAAFQGMTNFTMCLGPNCGSGQIHGGGNDQPIMTCTSCQFKTCFLTKCHGTQAKPVNNMTSNSKRREHSKKQLQQRF